MRVAISGKSGCGNTTISTMVASQMGYPLINFTFRNLAKERGIEFWDFCRLAEKDDSIDRELDARQVSMAMETTDCVLGSRLAIWVLKEADLKVYLTATTEERARRIQKREGGTLSQRMDETRRRDENDTARYKRIYGIDNTDPSVADMVIETDDLSPEQVASMIIREIHSHLAGTDH
ncbi:MAG: cytidylate kinase [Spirochaetae bacterium HGW-Spirochaetae-4]|nr:MAG: cytidylate kinase [Spirochaetae bacterium HGW-Spirochaetae-4]